MACLSHSTSHTPIVCKQLSGSETLSVSTHVVIVVSELECHRGVYERGDGSTKSVDIGTVVTGDNVHIDGCGSDNKPATIHNYCIAEKFSKV